jgi:imidazolonepropionase-like amidohydrolase
MAFGEEQPIKNKRLKISTLFSFASLLLLLSCTKETSEVIFDVQIGNVTIIDEQGKQVNNQNVFIGKDTIGHILPAQNQLYPKSKKHIDGTGKYLVLGFWDNHVHFRGGEALIIQNEKFLTKYLKHGITTVRDAGGDLTPQVQQWNAEIQRGNRLGPTIYTSGPKIDGPKARWAGSLPIDQPGDIPKALDSLVQLNVDYVKLYESTLSGTHYLDIIKQAESRNMITSGHMPFTVSLEETVAAGIDNIEHLYYILKGCSSKEAAITAKVKSGELSFWSSMEALIATYDTATAQKTFARLKAQNVSVTPTLHIGAVLSYLDKVNHDLDPYLKELEPAFVNTYEGRIRGALSASAKAKENRKALQQLFIQLANDLHEAGVSLLAGSDSGAYNSYIYPGSSLHKELKQLASAGLTPAEAMQTSTFNGSRFLKKEGYTMAVGGIADLVLLYKNPLEDIENTQSIELVIKNGRIVK